MVCIFSGIDDGLYGNDEIVEVVSPNALLKAVTFRRNCGATTNFATEVSILSASQDLPNTGGNLVGADGLPSITTYWVDNEHLTISGVPPDARRAPEFAGIHISYQ